MQLRGRVMLAAVVAATVAAILDERGVRLAAQQPANRGTVGPPGAGAHEPAGGLQR